MARHFPVIASRPKAGVAISGHPREKYIWVQVRILHETDKAVSVNNGKEIYVSKSHIYRIGLRNNIFKIYVKEDAVA